MATSKNTRILLMLIIIYSENVKLTRLTAIEDYEKEYGKAIHVSAIFRHGDRSPYASYPKDPHPIDIWPDGLGQLVKKGKQRLYKRGQWYKQRYSELVKTIKSHTNITTWSSHMDRTIMSAECFLAGFYRPDRSQYLDKFLAWEPIPVHTIPRGSDNMLWLGSIGCPAKAFHKKMFYRRKKWRKIYDKYQKTYDYLHTHTGYNFSKNDIPNSIDNIEDIYDILFVQNENNFTLPNWSKKVFPHQLLKILEAMLYKDVLHSLKMRRLFTGPLLKSIISNMLEKTENNSKKIFHFYSAHDVTISFLTYALGFPTEVYPPYGSTVMFELRRKNKNYFVTVFYSNSTLTTPYFVPIPNCETSCTLKNFIQATEYLIPNDWDRECQLKNTTFKSRHD